MDILVAVSNITASSYALLCVGYRSIQTFHALQNRHPTATQQPDKSEGWPSVDIVIPCYNENPEALAACLHSVLSQDYIGKLKIYLVDDGSQNRDLLAPIYDFLSDDPRFEAILLPCNAGKRKAQISAVRASSGDLIINIDSDTIIQSDVVRKLVAKMRDPAIGAAMGQLTASNRGTSWLTRLIDMEYWLACNEERAAQARFGAVLCCCGPCAIYRRRVFLQLLDKYETQFFRGKPSNFGEDRHMTLLVLKSGLRTGYVPDAIAATLVPDRMKSYLRQQLRWARSTYRDTPLALRLVPRLGRYLTLDIFGQNLDPLLLGLSILTGLWQLVFTETVPWLTILTVSMASVIRCCIASLHSRQTRFLTFVLHTPINVFLLIPLKLYALATLDNSSWLSRNLKTISQTKKLGGVYKEILIFDKQPASIDGQARGDGEGSSETIIMP